MITNRPNPNEAFPNPNIPSLCFIKNVVKNPRIIIGDYTYYDDVDGADQFEKHVTHFYDFIGDRLIIGKFCSIAKGVEFVMNGANHRMDGVTTYPFYVIGGDWGSAIAPVKDELPLKGDTIVGNDVWIGQHVTIMPGVHIGDILATEPLSEPTRWWPRTFLHTLSPWVTLAVWSESASTTNSSLICWN